MATYVELLSASQNPNLADRVKVACVIAAETIRVEVGTTPNHANRLLWAKGVFVDPSTSAARMLWAVLAQNAGVPLATIIGASDATVQNAVNGAVDVFANGSA
jgi:hypothetical protein